MLLTLVHALEYLVVRHPQPTLVLPKWCKEVSDAFDLDAALEGWVCVTNHSANRDRSIRIHTLDTKRIYMLGQRNLGEAFTRVVLTQILTRPRRHINERLRVRYSTYPDGYNAIHLRGLCEVWYPNVSSCTNAHSGDELCLMKTGYLNRTLKQATTKFERLPLLLMRDHEKTSWKEANRIEHEFGAVVPSDAGVYVDMLTMIHANYFIGNPGSTLSQNVMRVRDEIIPNSHARANMRGCTRVPGSGIEPVDKRFVIVR